MKTREQLIVESRDYFNCHPQAEVFLATTDGNFFAENNENAAANHAAKQSLIEKVEVFRIERREAFPDAPTETPKGKGKNDKNEKNEPKQPE